jgi:hypothetical protein
MRRLLTGLLAGLLAACSGAPVTRLLEDQSARARLVTLRGRVSLAGPSGAPIVVAILRVPEHAESALQIVDYQILAAPGTFSFFAPAGRYRVIAFEDTDRDQDYDATERLGAWNGFADVVAEEGSTTALDLEITGGVPGPLPAVAMPTAEVRSLRIGEIVPLDDPRFSASTGSRGMWEPLAFMEELGAGLFLLEPHVEGRTPVVLVHGMGGYPQEYRQLVASLDRARFEPWLVQYPSGWELTAVADYLSRGLIELTQTLSVTELCLVSHSMGGVVSRRALRFLAERQHPRLVRGFVTHASPLGGIPSAAAGVRFSPVQLPSWQSLVPDGPFVSVLYEQSLPETTDYTLVFAFDGQSAGDGVVPLTSQLRPEAQREARRVHGVHTGHVGILADDAALAVVAAALERCRGR